METKPTNGDLLSERIDPRRIYVQGLGKKSEASQSKTPFTWDLLSESSDRALGRL